MGRDPRDPGRIDRELWRDCRTHRRAQGDPRGGAGLRLEWDRGCDPMPSHRAARRLAVGLSLGRRAQARLAGAGGGMTRLATARRPRRRATTPELPGERQDVASKVCALDWRQISEELEAHGCATAPVLLTREECLALADMYGSEQPFRSQVIMARHGFGRGE